MSIRPWAMVAQRPRSVLREQSVHPMAVTATEVGSGLVWRQFARRLVHHMHETAIQHPDPMPPPWFVGRYVHPMAIRAPSIASIAPRGLDLAELEGRHPVELGEVDGRRRARIHPGRLERRLEIAPFGQGDRLHVGLRHIEKDRLTGNALAQTVEQPLRDRAARGVERADLVAVPAPPAHPEAAQLAVLHGGERHGSPAG